MKFKNPANDYVEEVSTPWLWTLFFGCFYFAVKGVWTHTVVSFFLAVFTSGLSWLVYPFFANGVMRAHYGRKGWKEVV